MTGKLPPTASVTSTLDGAKLFAPSAERNTQALCDLLVRHAPARGVALEIASGTGQHITAFAQAMPDLIWQPTEIAADRLASIDAYRLDAGHPNIAPPRVLDAGKTGWSTEFQGVNLIVLINLMHLIDADKARTIIAEAMSALETGGCLILYGPFLRDHQLTSECDARFHQQLITADPNIGYKNDADIKNDLLRAGACEVTCLEMPANNLAFLAKR